MDTCTESRRLVGHTDLVTSVAFSFDRKLILSSSMDATVKVWDSQTGLELLTLNEHTDAVMGAILANNERCIIFDKTKRAASGVLPSRRLAPTAPRNPKETLCRVPCPMAGSEQQQANYYCGFRTSIATVFRTCPRCVYPRTRLDIQSFSIGRSSSRVMCGRVS